MTKFRMAAVVIGLCASSQIACAGTPDYLNAGADYTRAYHYRGRDAGVQANGRCDGVSYGTGARSCGTATGGPVGGRN
ncbi:hypothetical protein [Beijerinckia sp. L45]|uniref:hypothetical protein n=1 Tax=Beijerinckia sp. L45 TaxID=1641855 RepID=UPI00131AF31F|nr:hypothetical protein [Beijerinckia sp. L45]